jgi:ribonuclease BN (tRNA processing enzyme)
MTQEQLNTLLAITSFTALLMPLVSRVLDKFFSKGKDKVEYSSDLLDVMNKTTDALKKAKDDLITSEKEYEKTIEAMRTSHDAALEALRVELNARINRQKTRIEELETIKRVYTITFDLVTHPNVELRNPQVKAMDDVSASQKMQTITKEQIKEQNSGR